jgi:Ca2+/Na+ antiporter
MGKCPPGIICIENMSMIFFIFCLIVFCYFIYTSNKNTNTNIKQKIEVTSPNQNQSPGLFSGWFNYPYNNLSRDTLLDPYAAPLRDERYIVPQVNMVPLGTVPINVSTNIGAVDTNYRQMGILTALSTKGKICALMGRPLFTNRDKWQYYTMSDQYNSIKLPISRNGKSCTNEYGCDRLFDGDTVYIEGINEAYKVTIYDNDTIRYIPAL